eukprot:6713577-Pyramimonas_sp.AAC.1
MCIRDSSSRSTREWCSWRADDGNASPLSLWDFAPCSCPWRTLSCARSSAPPVLCALRPPGAPPARALFSQLLLRAPRLALDRKGPAPDPPTEKSC